MRLLFSLFCGLVWSLSTVNAAPALPITVQLAETPALSPDGKTLAFSWQGDLWTVGSNGGIAKRLTQNKARDRRPVWSPDGKEIAFTSDREGSPQVWIMPSKGGLPQQLTWNTSGTEVNDWSADGAQLLTRGLRDHHWRMSQRLFLIPRQGRVAEQLVFDDYADDGQLSPDGNQVLFTREGPAWWRKGYNGSQSPQIWLYDIPSKQFTQLLAPPTGARWPIWKPDGTGFYCVALGTTKSMNLVEFNLESKAITTLTNLTDDSVVYPTLSRDGKVLIFRHLFDLYRYEPESKKPPKKITITALDDGLLAADEERRTLTTARDFSVTKDGLEVAFIAGGDVWVMDTELREPIQVTNTPEEEREPVFLPDGEALLYISDAGGKTDIWRAERADKTKYWWNSEKFNLNKLTDDATVESRIELNPAATKLAYVRGLGDLWTMTPAGKDAQQLLSSWNAPGYAWSPDGQWLAYSLADDDFNSDIWIIPSDGGKPPFNVSRHPDNDSQPVWSPDGKYLAYTGKRAEEQVDIFYVTLREADYDVTRRDRALNKALEKMQKGRPTKRETPAPSSTAAPGKEPPKNEPAKSDPPKSEPAAKPMSEPKPEPKPATNPAKKELFNEGVIADSEQQIITLPNGQKVLVQPRPTESSSSGASTPSGESAPKKPVVVTIDWTGLHDRIQRISIPNTSESSLAWSPDGKKLGFNASVDGKPGYYTVEFPDNLKPTQLFGSNLQLPRWSENGLWALVTGVPTQISSSGSGTGLRFAARQVVQTSARHGAIFDQCWRVMRDQYYDPKLGNKNWDAIRRKYQPAAVQAVDMEALTTVIQLMLGELNGSHLGFSPQGDGDPDPGAPPANPAVPSEPTMRTGKWQPVTAHLGVRFVTEFKGPGIKIRDVLPGGPAEKESSLLKAGEIILSIDGTAVDPAYDLTQVLNGALERDIELRVKDTKDKERTVVIRPTSYTFARRMLYDHWIKQNQAVVEKLTNGKLGYLHISGMNFPSLYKFEEELYSVGAGKEGLIIDVRENGGGSTTDHLLTMLTQAQHAVTIPRGSSKPGYPQDRIIYATWRKPIIVLCNQNSFSNAEIFSHAIKQLKRGKVVGVTTAGGVISTGAAQIMDAGVLRLPFRGWFSPVTGEDMELNGAVPDAIVWPMPGEIPAGKDQQLQKAVELLQEDVKAFQQQVPPKFRYATER